MARTCRTLDQSSSGDPVCDASQHAHPRQSLGFATVPLISMGIAAGLETLRHAWVLGTLRHALVP